jgi:general secretion pathway protein D
MPPPSTSGNTSTNFMEETLPAGVLKLQGVDMQQALLFYSELVGRTVLRPNTLPNTPITLWAQSDLTRREAIQAMDAVFGLNGITMINVGDKFVKAVVQASANMEAAPFHKGDASQLPEMGQYVTHVVQLKYAKPSEMVQVLTPLSKIPNAAMPIDSSMILILRDYAENVKRMLELIKEVDVSVPSEYVSEVIPIKYALSADIANALNSLGSGGGGTSIGSSGTSGGTTGARSSFGGRSGASGSSRFGGSSYGTGMQSGTMPGFNQMGTTTGAQTTPGASGSFTDRLRNLMSRAAVSGDIQVIGQTKIIADERTNSLLIFATREDMKVIKDIVAKLDVVLAQVLIEAVIIEVQIGPNTKDFGISYLQHPQSSGNVSGVGAIGKPFLTPSDFVTSGGSNSSASALQGGFNYLASFGQDLDITLQAIATETRAKVLQRPRIQTSHAVQAQLFVGESRPYPTSSYYGGGAYGSYSSIQQLQIGVTLDVTPLINPDGLVVMDIHQTIENYSGFTEITGVGQVPNTTRKEAAAKVAVRDRDTIMLGGLIEDDKNRSGSGVPFLMDIPIIGYLFRSTSTGQTRKELIVLIRPTVLPTPEVAAMTALSEKERMPGVRRAEAEFLNDEEKQLLRTQEELKQLENPERKKKASERWIDRVD